MGSAACIQPAAVEGSHERSNPLPVGPVVKAEEVEARISGYVTGCSSDAEKVCGPGCPG